MLRKIYHFCFFYISFYQLRLSFSQTFASNSTVDNSSSFLHLDIFLAPIRISSEYVFSKVSGCITQKAYRSNEIPPFALFNWFYLCHFLSSYTFCYCWKLTLIYRIMKKSVALNPPTPTFLKLENFVVKFC